MLQGTYVLRDARTANPFKELRMHMHTLCMCVTFVLFLIVYNTIVSVIYAWFVCPSNRATPISRAKRNTYPYNDNGECS